MFIFRKICCALFFETSVLIFALSSYYRRLDSVFKMKNEDDKYYPQIYLEECKYKGKKAKKKTRHIKDQANSQWQR